MPRRHESLLTGSIYHIYNRGNNKQRIFLSHANYDRAEHLLAYYSYKRALSYSEYLRIGGYLAPPETELVRVLAYCLMPNHYHLLLEQLVDGGIASYIGKVQNAYARYFNIAHKNSGHLFTGRFKSVLIHDQNQLLHTSRYIHLNPYSDGLVETASDLESYPYSSYSTYTGSGTKLFCNTEQLLTLMGSRERYSVFVTSYANYQRNLNYIKHTLRE